MPQAMSWLWPMTTPGMPGEGVARRRRTGRSLETVRQCRPIWYQTEGSWGARCGSLASSGLPVVVCCAGDDPGVGADAVAVRAEQRRELVAGPRRGPASWLCRPSARRRAVPLPRAGRCPPCRARGAVGRPGRRTRPGRRSSYRAVLDDRLVPARTGRPGTAPRSASGSSRLVISARSISSCMLPRRSQAIALSQATESTGVHFCGLVVVAEAQGRVLDGDVRAALSLR